jgi:hypothetical protein
LFPFAAETLERREADRVMFAGARDRQARMYPRNTLRRASVLECAPPASSLTPSDAPSAPAPRPLRRFRNRNRFADVPPRVFAERRRTEELSRDRKNKHGALVINRFGGADGQQVTTNQYADVVDVLGLEVIEPDPVHISCQSSCDSKAHQEHRG